MVVNRITTMGGRAGGGAGAGRGAGGGYQKDRIYTITPHTQGGRDGFQVNYTVPGFSPGSVETKHNWYKTEAGAVKFAKSLDKAGYNDFLKV